MIYNHQFVSSKMMIELLNNFKMTFVKRCIFIIIFQFIIVISILWWLSKHDKMIEKIMLTTQYTNSYKICSKLFHENEALTSENLMLMNLISFFWFLIFFSLCGHGLYDSFVPKWRNDVVTPRCLCLLKRFFILGFDFRIFFSFNSLIVFIVLPHEPISGCQIGVWDKSNQIKSLKIFIKILKKNFLLF